MSEDAVLKNYISHRPAAIPEHIRPAIEDFGIKRAHVSKISLWLELKRVGIVVWIMSYRPMWRCALALRLPLIPSMTAINTDSELQTHQIFGTIIDPAGRWYPLNSSAAMDWCGSPRTLICFQRMDSISTASIYGRDCISLMSGRRECPMTVSISACALL